MAAKTLAITPAPAARPMPRLPERYYEVTSQLRGVSKESYFHSRRVAGLACRMGALLGLTTVELHYLNIGAELHDIGKIVIPDHILHSDAALNNQQWTVMRTHSMKGAKMASARCYDRRIAEVILYHHERWDGGGYPVGLKRENIPLHARIVTLVDAYDTMISTRVYQSRPRQIRDAMGEIERCAGAQFDPELAEVFLKYLRSRYLALN